MRLKNIISIVAFVTAFTFSAALVGLFAPQRTEGFVVRGSSYDRSTAQNITRFIQQDINNGDERNKASYTYNEDYSLSSPNIIKRARAVAEYSDVSGSMNYDNLPQDFQLAWLKHMGAWHNYSDFLQKAKTQKMDTNEMCQLESQYNREINLTWYQVLRVGSRYGANVENAY